MPLQAPSMLPSFVLEALLQHQQRLGVHCRTTLNEVNSCLEAQPAYYTFQRLWTSDTRKGRAASLQTKLHDFVTQLQVHLPLLRHIAMHNVCCGIT